MSELDERPAGLRFRHTPGAGPGDAADAPAAAWGRFPHGPAPVETGPATAPRPTAPVAARPDVAALPLLAAATGVVAVLGLCVWLVKWDPPPPAPAATPAATTATTTTALGSCMTADESRRLWASVPGLADAVRAHAPDRVVSDDSAGVCRRELFYTARGLRVVIEEQADKSFRVLGAMDLEDAPADPDRYLPAAETVRRLTE